MKDAGLYESRGPRRSSGELLAIDLFSGAGGLTQGLKEAGFRVIGAVEMDRLACATYRRNHRLPTIWKSDIRRVSGKAVRRALRLRRGQLDLLAGCPPCQGFSTMRTRNRGSSVRDPRNKLVFEFLRFARALRPRAVMMENVPALAKSARMGQLLAGLRRLGYSAKIQVLDAANFGVPQRRRRVILLGVRGSALAMPQPGEATRTVADAIKALARPGKSGDSLHDLAAERSEKVMKLIKAIPRNGGSRSDLGQAKQLRCHRKIDGFKDVYGRMAWDAVAPTITSGCINPSKGRFLHPTQNRAITLREAALLQTFPPGYWFSLARGKYPAALLIGNALPPRFIRAVATHLKRLYLGSRR